VTVRYNPAMPKHVVRPGECLTVIARQYGFLDYRTVYEHPDNQDLRKKRPDPNILFPGDVVAIPQRKEKSVSVSTGQSHRFRVLVPKKELQLKLLDDEGKPIANEPYVLEVDGEPPLEGKQTDGEGVLKERVPLSRGGATLTLRGRELRLRFGGLNPLRDCPSNDVSGVQGRLQNLGYNPGPVSGVLGERTRIAIAIFQSDEGLEMTGEPDEKTVSKLEEVYGC
jgi:N-acetylmuramoyl-L-alanine amidase